MSEEREVQQVLANYVRAADRRNGPAMSELFVEEARVEIFEGQQAPVQIGLLEGPATIGAAVAGMMAPHPQGGWSHHTTHDPIINVQGDAATIDAQFIVYNTAARVKPTGGWPGNAAGAQGQVLPIEAGYYRSHLVRKNGEWKFFHHRIYLDLPMAFPGA